VSHGCEAPQRRDGRGGTGRKPGGAKPSVATKAKSSKEEAARIAGLTSFETPTLEAVETRRLQLWALTLSLLVVTTGGVILLTVARKIELAAWLTPRLLQVGLFGFILLFCAYAIEKELQLRRLSALLVEERVLSAALTNRLREVSTLLAAAKAMNLVLDLEEVLETILRCALELLNGSDGSIMLVRGKNELRTVGTFGASPARGAVVRFGEGVAGKVAMTREPVLVSGVIRRESGDGARIDVPSPTSSMSAPLINRDLLLGVLNLNAAAGRSFTEYDLRALSLFAEQAAGSLANAQLLEEQRLLATQNLYQALHDSLTNLPNRALFLDRVGHALRRRRSSDRHIAVLFLDLDDFKRINDSLGHAAGDEVLVAFAERLRACVRSADTVARFGGDEFAVLVEDVTSSGEATLTTERILKTMNEPFVVGGRSVVLRSSIGIALDDPGLTNAEELVRNADLAMHTAKGAGKGQVGVFEEGMHRDAVERLDLEAEMRRALGVGGFVLHFQPIVTLASRAVVGVEALVRWQHPRHGLLAASSFVPLAERIGILDAIDRWVLAEACRTVQALTAEVAVSPRLTMHVNISPVRLQSPGLVDEVAALVAERSIDPPRLVLEITEGVVLRDTEGVLLQLEGLKSLGVRLALDDFGTGFSSLSHLRRFPVDVVKIDRIFIEGLAKDAGAIRLVQAILRMGQGLSLDVIAEGIEQQAQVDTLLRVGCGLGQGYLLSEPLSHEALVPFLQHAVQVGDG